MKRNNVKQITIRLTADEYAHVKQLSEYEIIDNPPRRGKDYNDQLRLVKGISGRVKTRGGEAR